MARMLIGNIKGPQGKQGNDGEIGPVGPVGPPGPMGAVDNTTPIEFTEAAQRENLTSGDSIATLFGKQKKWNADLEGGLMPYVPTIHVVYDSDNKSEALEKLNNPTLIFGARDAPYCILFSDNAGDSPLKGGESCIYGYTYPGGNYGCQIALSYHNSKDRFLIRNLFGNTWSNWANIYDTAHKPTPEDIGAISAEPSRYTLPKPEENNVFSEISAWDFIITKQGSIVNLYINIWAKMEAVPSLTQLVTIPEGYRPKDKDILCNCIAQDGTAMLVRISRDGVMGLYNGNKNINTRILAQTITYAVD